MFVYLGDQLHQAIMNEKEAVYISLINIVNLERWTVL